MSVPEHKSAPLICDGPDPRTRGSQQGNNCDQSDPLSRIRAMAPRDEHNFNQNSTMNSHVQHSTAPFACQHKIMAIMHSDGGRVSFCEYWSMK